MDILLECEVKDQKGTRKMLVPLELKTGRVESFSHKLQTTMYCMMLMERYDTRPYNI